MNIDLLEMSDRFSNVEEAIAVSSKERSHTLISALIWQLASEYSRLSFFRFTNY
ncbi:hypothetical protein [Nostoc sp. 'Peltigera membranacea cyanobiont' 210A]|uniref:hypothetical protein n=1 Tax=Nostoc sp. 'Peltigera membranacea cyanobiont' 210A TaxID=2014529 RepID=UPI00167E2360|nr:hypothetical protein [Nostoc sp. 'Peltigera membranacea cyanobiont' 210A]